MTARHARHAAPCGRVAAKAAPASAAVGTAEAIHDRNPFFDPSRDNGDRSNAACRSKKRSSCARRTARVGCPPIAIFSPCTTGSEFRFVIVKKRSLRFRAAYCKKLAQ